MVFKGLSAFYGKERRHIITTQIEHKCVLDTCRNLEMQGFKVTYLPLQSSGILDVELLKKTIDESKEKVLCVSTIFVNNEIGVIQPIEEIGRICRERGIFYHTDAAQAVGKVPIDVNALNIDLLSISGHKVYGPKGIGALYIRRKPRVRLLPLINGGGQERGLRSGTLSPFLCVGLGKACEVAKREMKNDEIHIRKLYAKILKFVRERIPQCQLNGHETQRYMGNINLSFAYVEG
jgi:cysteine desulfurase